MWPKVARCKPAAACEGMEKLGKNPAQPLAHQLVGLERFARLRMIGNDNG
jgi:hypothetical protein